MAHIKTYARIKPSKSQYDDYDTTPQTLYLRVPENVHESKYTNNAKQRSTVNHEFRFNYIFNEDVNQDEVFNKVAKGIIEGFLDGYNGTIFAYGQTGSGKTYTVEGSARKYEERGLAHRALSQIYKILEPRQESEDIKIHVSYMEIYQEVGYDLLNTTARTNSVVTHFPKVAVVEGPHGSCIVRNLSTHLAANEDVAQSLLLQGQANRKVAETPMNQRSSRSHAVFTITLSAKKQGSDVISKSKLHLVDLAGSERVAKTGVAGQQLSEAKFINLSLHHLESVIVALQRDSSYATNSVNTNGRPRSALPLGRPSSADLSRPSSTPPIRRIGSADHSRQGKKGIKRLRSKSAIPYKRNRWFAGKTGPSLMTQNVSQPVHIPYRNSLLTMMLRDSLGGNCQTAMIATLNLEEENLNESISTCRFAQRVACVTNVLRKNEEIDDKSMIRRLRKRIAELETEVSLLKAGQGIPFEDEIMGSKLTDEEKVACAQLMQAYLGGRVIDPISAGVTHPLKFRECLRILKMMILDHYSRQEAENNVNRSRDVKTTGNGPSRKEVIANSNHERKDTPPWKPNGAARVEAWIDSNSEQKNHQKSHDNGITTKRYQNEGNVHLQTMRARSVSPHRARSQTADDPGETKSRNCTWSRASSASSAAKRSYLLKTDNDKPVRKEYKSPFEKKKEAEIKRLDQKVDETSAAVQKDQHQLMEMQYNLREQQLNNIKEEISMKLSQTSDQLADQHAFVMRLRRTGADHDLISQERLVEKQLIKTKTKMEKRLVLVEDQLALITKNREEMNQCPEKVEEKAQPKKLEEKYSHCVKKDGKVNTKQVLDLLQIQDKELQRQTAKLEREKVLTLTQEVELKEQATRHKLQLLRQKLASSRASGYSGSAMSNISDFNTSFESSFLDDSNINTNDGPVALKLPVEDDQQSTLSQAPTQFSLKTRSSSVSIPSKWGSQFGGSTNVEQMAQDMNYNRKEVKMFEDSTKLRNGSIPSGWSDILNNNRPMSGTSSVFSTPPIKEAGYEELDFSSLPGFDFKRSSANNDGDGDTVLEVISNGEPSNDDLNITNGYSDTKIVSNGEHHSDELTNGYYNETMFPNSEHNHPVGNVRNGYGDENDLDLTGSISPIESCEKPNSVTLSMAKSVNDNIRGTENFTDYQKCQIAGRPRASTLESTNVETRTRSSTIDSVVSEKSSSFETYLPSEYVNKNHKLNSFDARKMGLGKNTFDTALQSMLGDPSKIEFKHEQYDKFARKKSGKIRSNARDDRQRSTPNVQKSKQKENQNKNNANEERGRSRKREQRDERINRSKPAVMWGPEAKQSLGDRLAEFLQMESFGSPRRKPKGKSFEDSDVHPYQKPQIVAEETTDGVSGDWKRKLTKDKPKPEIDVDSYRIRIKALQDDEAEQTYMTSARRQKDRVKRIRQARLAAETIQRAWRKHLQRTGRQLVSAF